jgi:putative transcriptional regulator
MAVEQELRAPCFLVAVPQLGDPNFNRGVVLLLEHGNEGSMGLVVNRPSDLDMGTFCASQNMVFNGDNSLQVFSGGPVQTDRAFILHSSSHEGPETETIMGSLRLSYSLESLRVLVQTPPERFRVYLGYAGWGDGQLAEEITAGAWLVSSLDEALVFAGDSERVWETALREMGIDPVQLMHSGAVH